MAADIELLFLHALPFDGTMWDAQRSVLAITSHAPTLYGHGNDLVAWAAAALACARRSRLVVVGCSVGGSCALELARLAPDRVAALVLIGTKAEHNPNPALRDSALALLEEGLLEEAWGRFWQPLFAPGASSAIVERARQGAMNRHPADLARGVSAFHARRSRADTLATLAARCSSSPASTIPRRASRPANVRPRWRGTAPCTSSPAAATTCRWNARTR